MKHFLPVIILLISCAVCHAQGQVVFANRVDAAGIDAPVFHLGRQFGPGPTYTAELLLVLANGSMTSVITTPFQSAGSGVEAIRDRYWSPQVANVPGVSPGERVKFRVRAWQTAAGSYENSIQGRGESPDFVIEVGGGTLPPANLRSFQSFNVTDTAYWPEPSTYVLGLVGSAIFFFWGRRRNG